MSEWLVRGDEGQERAVDSRSEAEEVKSDMESLGVDCEIIQPEATDGGTEAEVVEADTSPSEVEQPTQTAAQKLPNDRDVGTNPLEWMPGDFVDTIEGTQAINKKGFRVLQHFYGISTTSDMVCAPEETDHEYCRVKATAEMDGQTAEAYGSAHIERGDDPELLAEMADTRAKSRVLSDITGVGAVAVAELRN